MEELQLSGFSGGRKSVGCDGCDEERGKAEVADMAQATVPPLCEHLDRQMRAAAPRPCSRPYCGKRR